MNISTGSFIHETVVLDESVSIGRACRIWANCVIQRGAVLGEDVSVGANTVILGVTIGDGCRIGSGVVLSPSCRVGRDVFIGPNAVICNDVYPFADKTGYDSVRVGRDLQVILEDGCSIGANATVLPGCRVGRGALVAAGATLTQSLPAGVMWTRYDTERAVPEDWMNRRHRWL